MLPFSLSFSLVKLLSELKYGCVYCVETGSSSGSWLFVSVVLYQNVAFGAGHAVGNWAVVKIQLNFNGSNTDGLFTMAVSNSCLSP